MRNVPYLRAVGTLLHIAIYTRPDIAKAVQVVSQFMSNPGEAHWSAVKRILAYLKFTKDLILSVGGQSSTPAQLVAWCDADHAASPDHARSTSGYAIFIGQGCVSWSAKKQTCTAISTGEAEYYAAVWVGREILWLRQLLAEVGFAQSSGTPLWTDSTSALKMVKSADEITNRTKHIRIAYHWIREAVAAELISPDFTPGEDNVADIFTKGLPAPRHTRLVGMLGLSTRRNAS